MKSGIKVFAACFFIVGSFFFFQQVFAQGFGEYEYNEGGGSDTTPQPTCVENKDSYCLLEPLPIGNGNGAPLDRIDVTNSFGSYINIIVKILIGVVGVLAVVTIVLGGVQYMTTDAFSGKEGGKEMITRSVFGLLIALGSVLLLNTINPQLTSVGLNDFGVNVKIDDFSYGDGTSSGDTSVSGSGKRACEQTTGTRGETWPGQDSAVRDQLTAAGIDVVGTNGACKTINDAQCTTVYGLPDGAIQSLINIKNSCGADCAVVVTGGTECWQHASHGPGLPRVDLRKNTKLDAYLKNKFPASGKGKWGSASNAQFYGSGPAVVDEGNHWHMHNNW